tara:strand:- start:66 stop:689 length:624 start_codon:yes stop_codon:yes gene_type:complete
MKYFLSIFLSLLYAQDCPEGYVDDIFGENCIPELFYHNVSTSQAYYYFLDVNIDGVFVNNDDWVGAFNEDICIGARQWDINQCVNQICEVPVLGDIGNNNTEGYITSGQIPTFKIFDASSNVYYNATPSENIPWQNLEISVIDLLEADMFDCQEGDFNFDSIINVLDIVILVNCIFEDSCSNCFDLNYDDEINVVDIVTLVNIVLNP